MNKLKEMVCDCCGEVFLDYTSQHRGNHIFCSYSCNTKYNLKHGTKIRPGIKGYKHRKQAKAKISKTRIERIASGEIIYKQPRCKHKNSPNKPELQFIKICEKYNLPFKYTGDGSFWIENINPDFVDCNGKKVVVEVFGDYWHSPLFNLKIKYYQTLEGRNEILKRYGWKLIVLWESDFKRDDSESFVLNLFKTEGIL